MTRIRYDMESFLKGDLTLQQIWDDSFGECPEETRADMHSLAGRICSYEKKRKAGRRLLNVSLGMAACLAIVFGVYALSAGGRNVEYIQAFAPKGEVLPVVLPDSSRVVLQSGSTLAYPAVFTGRDRKVLLTGTANFSVARDPRRPFIVHTQYLDIEALGTKFCVMAYPNDYSANAILLEGSIRVDVKSDSVRSYILQPDSRIRYTPSEGSILCQSVNARRLLSWEDGSSVFQNSSFGDVISEIERRYGVIVSYDDCFASVNSFFLRLHPEDNLDDALDMVTDLTGNAEYSITGSRVEIRKKAGNSD